VNTDPSVEAWRELALRELQGAPLERLEWRSPEGLRAQPLYPSQPSELPGRALLLASAGWTVCPEYARPEPALVGAEIAADLKRGASAVWVRLDERLAAGVAGPPAPVGQHGVVVRDANDLAAVLEGVELGRTPVTLAVGAAGKATLGQLVVVAERRGAALAGLRGHIGCDPLGALARRGELAWPIEHALSDMCEVTAFALAAAPRLRTALVDVGAYHDAGATAADQIAALLATGAVYLRALVEAGATAAGARQIGFAAAVGRDVFLELAKLRAMRLTWARLVAACGGDAQAQRMHLHARGSWRERTTVDPWVGLLRGTGETFAAAVGGADSIAVTAMDAALGEPGPLGRRMALNTQLILAEESGLGRVADPAGGSGYVEALTDQLARAAWTRFQAIERAGGMIAALRSGEFQTGIAASAAVTAQQVASVRVPIVGVSRFAAAQEQPTGAAPAVDLLEGAGVQGRAHGSGFFTAGEDVSEDMSGGAGGSEGLAGGSAGAGVADVSRGMSGEAGDDGLHVLVAQGVERVPPLVRARLAEPFEALRGGAGHAVALVGFGAPSQWRARVEFCRAYFGVAGMVVHETAGAEDVEMAVQQFAETGARAAVICSADPVYFEIVPAIAPRLRGAGATVVLLAGRPKDLDPDGIDLFVQLGGDAVALLGELQRRLEVRP
jgi:methylmalonyl-CoA mutase